MPNRGLKNSLYSTQFVAATVYPVSNGVRGTGIIPDSVRYGLDVAQTTPPGIQILLSDTNKYSQKAVAELCDIYCAYTTYTGDAMAYGRFTDVRNPQAYSTGNPYSSTSTYPTGLTPDSPSGYYRAELYPYDIRSGCNIGLTPTYGTGLPDNTGDVQEKVDMDQVRSVGMKTPMVFAGLGYTTEGLPVPSLYQELVAASGVGFYENSINAAFLIYSGLSNSTTYGLLQQQIARKEYDKRLWARDVRNRPDLWKAGPLDIRYDSPREMWVAAPEVYGGYTTSNISSASGRYAPTAFSSGTLALIIGRYKNAGVPKPDHELLIINRSITTDIPSGTFVIAMRAHNNEYWPIHIDCAPDRSGYYQ